MCGNLPKQAYLILCFRDPDHCNSLPFGAADDGHELIDLFTLSGLVSRRNGVLDTWRDVISQDLLLEPPQGRSDGCNLRHDINAIPTLLDHASEATYLTFDALDALGAGRVECASHDAIYPQGVIRSRP